MALGTPCKALPMRTREKLVKRWGMKMLAATFCRLASIFIPHLFTSFSLVRIAIWRTNLFLVLSDLLWAKKSAKQTKWCTHCSIINRYINYLMSSRHFPLRSIFRCVSKSVMNQNDIFCCKTLSGARQSQYRHCPLRHWWLQDMFKYKAKRHCMLWDICSCQTFAVVRHFQ